MFSFFGKIYCLNLISRHDRYEHSQLVFKKLRCPVEFFRVKRHPSSGAQGCFESHIKMINKAYDLDAPNVLIFEDDLIYNPISYTVLQRAIDFMSGRKDWDIFYLGACPSPFIYTRKVRGYEDIYQTRGPCTHAYVVNRKTMHKMKDLKYEGTAIDNYIEKNMRCFAVYPTLFFQGGFDTDVTDRNFIRRFFMHPTLKPMITRIQEMYAYRIGAPLHITVTFVVLIALFLVLMRSWVNLNGSP